MAGDVRNFSDGVLTVKDGTGSPKTLVVGLDQGTLKWSKKRKVDPVHNRQNIVANREGRKQMHDVSFSVAYDFMAGDTSGIVPSLKEALFGDGVAATQTWKGTDAAAGSAYCVDLSLEITSPVSTEKSETVSLLKFFVESYDVGEGETANMVDIKGKAVTVSSVRH